MNSCLSCKSLLPILLVTFGRIHFPKPLNALVKEHPWVEANIWSSTFHPDMSVTITITPLPHQVAGGKSRLEKGKKFEQEERLLSNHFLSPAHTHTKSSLVQWLARSPHNWEVPCLIPGWTGDGWVAYFHPCHGHWVLDGACVPPPRCVWAWSEVPAVPKDPWIHTTKLKMRVLTGDHKSSTWSDRGKRHTHY